MIDEQGRWEEQGAVMTATEEWELPGVLEPSVVYESGAFKMWYRGGGLGGAHSQIGYATSADGQTWTKDAGNPIFGDGVGGEASHTNEPNMFVHNGLYWLYYNTNTVLKVATSADGITDWTITAPLMALPSGTNGWGNTTVWIEGATWHMIVDAYLVAQSCWVNYCATSADGLSWALGNGGDPLLTLQLVTGGSYGSLHVVDISPKVGGRYQGWYLASDESGDVISDIHHASSADLLTWAVVSPRPIIARIPETETQAADPHVLEVGGSCLMYYDGCNAIDSVAAIKLATFPGSLIALVSGRAPHDVRLADLLTEDGHPLALEIPA